jgi:hypothetical protein
MCVLLAERVSLLSVNRWILHQRGLTFPATTPPPHPPPPCAESECKQKLRYDGSHLVVFLTSCFAVVQSTAEAFDVLDWLQLGQVTCLLASAVKLVQIQEKKQEMSVYRKYMYNDKFHMATCFDSHCVIFRPFELIALTKQLVYMKC